MQDKENISEVKTGNQHIIQNKELNIFEALIPVVLLMCMLAYNIFFTRTLLSKTCQVHKETP